MINFAVIGYGVMAQEKIKEIAKLAGTQKHPVVEVKIAKLKPTKSLYNYNGQMVQCNMNMDNYLIKDAKIVQENYL